MKHKVIAGLAIFALVLAVVLTARSGLRAAVAPSRSAVAAVHVAAAPAGMPAEPHPEIRAALASLRQARRQLQHGAHDFGGHRAQALRLTDQAIQECRAALAYDRH